MRSGTPSSLGLRARPLRNIHSPRSACSTWNARPGRRDPASGRIRDRAVSTRPAPRPRPWAPRTSPDPQDLLQRNTAPRPSTEPAFLTRARREDMPTGRLTGEPDRRKPRRHASTAERPPRCLPQPCPGEKCGLAPCGPYGPGPLRRERAPGLSSGPSGPRPPGRAFHVEHRLPRAARQPPIPRPRVRLRSTWNVHTPPRDRCAPRPYGPHLSREPAPSDARIPAPLPRGPTRGHTESLRGQGCPAEPSRRATGRRRRKRPKEAPCPPPRCA